MGTLIALAPGLSALGHGSFTEQAGDRLRALGLRIVLATAAIATGTVASRMQADAPRDPGSAGKDRWEGGGVRAQRDHSRHSTQDQLTFTSL
jgi:hypothetical protein